MLGMCSNTNNICTYTYVHVGSPKKAGSSCNVPFTIYGHNGFLFTVLFFVVVFPSFFQTVPLKSVLI